MHRIATGATRERLPMAITLGLCLVAACEPNGLYTSSDGEAYLAGIVEVGSTVQEVEKLLADNEIEFSEIDATACGADGDIWMDPRFVCAGSPALWLSLSENARPYDPLYSPTMNAFLAFNEEGSLVSTAVLIMGGD